MNGTERISNDVIDWHWFCLVWQGKTWLQANIDIEVSRASKTARHCGHRLGLRVLLKSEKFEGQPIPRWARLPNDLMKYYVDPNNRGYLADPVELEKARETNRLASEVDWIFFIFLDGGRKEQGLFLPPPPPFSKLSSCSWWWRKWTHSWETGVGGGEGFI